MDKEWILWPGNLFLPPAFYEYDMVEVKFRDGSIRGPECEAWMFAGWNHRQLDSDIVAYRVVV